MLLYQCRLANYAPVVHVGQTGSTFFFLESVPEAECLVAGAGDYGLAVRAHGEVEDAVGVAGEGDDLLHARVLPHDDLVLRVTVRRHDLVAVLGPCKVAHLAAGVEAANEVCRCCRRNRDVACT